MFINIEKFWKLEKETINMSEVKLVLASNKLITYLATNTDSRKQSHNQQYSSPKHYHCLWKCMYRSQIYICDSIIWDCGKSTTKKIFAWNICCICFPRKHKTTRVVKIILFSYFNFEHNNQLKSCLKPKETILL